MRSRISVVAFWTSLLHLMFATLPAFADEPKRDPMPTDLKVIQGLWQTFPGGIEHRDGTQVVQNPAQDGDCFFIFDNRLIWLDHEGKPTGKQEIITLDTKPSPKRITFTPVGKEKDTKPSHGIYSIEDGRLTIHLGLDNGPAPKQFLELNRPVKQNDGSEWIVDRKPLREP